MRKIFNQKGLTLLELLVAITLSGFVMSAILLVMNQTIKYQQTVNTKVDFHTQTRSFLTVLTRDITNASQVSVVDGSTLQIINIDYSNETSETVQYSLDQGQHAIIKQTFGSTQPPAIVCSHISTLSFSQIAGRLSDVNIDLTTVNSNGEQVHLKSSATARWMIYGRP